MAKYDFCYRAWAYYIFLCIIFKQNKYDENGMKMII